MYEFEYQKPASLDDVTRLLGDDEAKLVAGGMTLIPTLKMRLAKPTQLVDLSAIPSLKGISEDGDAIVIGAMTRHADVNRSDVVKRAIPALAAMAGMIGDPAVRNRGTIGGSVANNDPNADYPAGCLGLGATIVTNKRRIKADDFFKGLFETALESDEIITKVMFPTPKKSAYVKFPNPASRYALVGVFVSKRGADIRVAVTGAGANGVFRVTAFEEALKKRFGAKSLDGLSVPAEGMGSDIHGSAEYRAHLVGVLARRAVAALQVPIRLGGVDIHTSSSIGIAVFPADGNTFETLIANADAAMYCAKQRGRNNIQSYAPGMNSVTQEKVKLESDLHEALALRQFELHYQPKVDTATGGIHGVEALVRWRHPQRGVVLPGEFIPLAEACGLIDSIGAWVVREACRQTRAWQLEGLPPLRVAVNLSAFQFRHGNLLQMIREALQAADLEPRFLEVEITESALMSDPEESVTILEALSRMGVVVSVDDFGTGYSSMSYLRRFPIDKLKIDRGFIAELMSRADDASIVQAIVSLAHSLHLKVVAEGVETQEQLALLKRLGCDQYQGFCFSPAVPAENFATLLRESQLKSDSSVDPASDRTHSKLAVYRPR